MSSIDWQPIIAPIVGGLVTAAGLVVGALMTGLVGRVNRYLTAHGQASAAAAISNANNVVQSALQTSASTMAGKISSGALDYGNKAALLAEATREAALVETRVPEMLAVLKPAEGALVASMLGKVDAAVVASPTIPSAPIISKN